MLAATREEILARFELLDEDGRPLDPVDFPGVAVLRGAKSASSVVGFRIRATGDERWAIVSATPLADDDGGPGFAINAFQDITERKVAERERDRERARLTEILAERLADETRLAELIRSEQARSAELDALIAAIGEGIVVADADGAIRLANRTARDMLTPFDQAAGLATLLARFEFGSQGPSPRERRHVVADGDRVQDAAIGDGIDDLGAGSNPAAGLRSGTFLARLDGEPSRWIEISAYPVPGSREEPSAETIEEPSDETILVLRDVSARRAREQARDAFIGMLSHELRTPVTTIYAGAKVLARRHGLNHETRSEIFEDIHGEAERLHRLVEDVVALTRLGEGALEIGNEPVLLQRFLPPVVRSEEGRWPDATFELALPQDLPAIAGDATYVEQVIRNLLANAVKYSGPGSHVTIDARAEGDEVAVRVLDHGPGFPEADARRLFDLYYRASSTAQKVSGSGIGLFVCSRLIEAMGGRMWAANRPTGGAEFGFALSIADEDPDDEDPDREEEEARSR